MYFLFRKINKILLISLLACSMIILPVQYVVQPLYAQSQKDWDKKIDEAEQIFYSGQFSKAENILKEGLQSGELTQEQKSRAYRILGLSYLSRELESQAKDAIENLLEIVPDYQPNPDQDPPQFIRMVEDVKQQEAATGKKTNEAQQQQPDELQKIVQEEQKKGINKTWYYVAGGVIVVVVAAILLSGSSGGGGNDNFPTPPGRP